MNLFRNYYIHFSTFKSKLIVNSFWGVAANLLQNILFSVFFIIVARVYNPTDFSSYILANTIYGLLLAFSSLGLGQWFVRRLLEDIDKEQLIHQFFKLQFIIGVAFYLLIMVTTWILYKDHLVRQLSLIIGINILFDNIIYVIKHVNIAQMDQKKTFLIQTVEAVLKFILGVVVVVFPVSMVTLALLIITLRFITLNVFISIGTSFPVRIAYLLKVKIDTKVIKEIISDNWPFIVIGSMSVLYWKIGNLFIVNYLSLKEVSHYEISYKLFSMAEIIPVIISSSVFPVLLKKLNEDRASAMKFYNKVFLAYTFYGLLSFTFIYSFAEQIVPFLFGSKYIVTAKYCKEMFFTILIFPTAILQANLIISLHREKIDMWLNILSLVLNMILSMIGLYFLKSITAINISIFISFLLFHILQDHILIKLNMLTFKVSIFFYLTLFTALAMYYAALSYFIPIVAFCLFWLCVSVLVGYYIHLYAKRQLSSAI